MKDIRPFSFVRESPSHWSRLLRRLHPQSESEPLCVPKGGCWAIWLKSSGGEGGGGLNVESKPEVCGLQHLLGSVGVHVSSSLQACM